jgi:hypothetical protein
MWRDLIVFAHHLRLLTTTCLGIFPHHEEAILAGLELLLQHPLSSLLPDWLLTIPMLSRWCVLINLQRMVCPRLGLRNLSQAMPAHSHLCRHRSHLSSSTLSMPGSVSLTCELDSRKDAQSKPLRCRKARPWSQIEWIEFTARSRPCYPTTNCVKHTDSFCRLVRELPSLPVLSECASCRTLQHLSILGDVAE